MSSVRWIVLRGGAIQLTKSKEGFWQDEKGTIYGLPDYSHTRDNITRCGVGIASLPASHPLTAACAPHDYMYSSPVYQAFHTRSEADAWLKSAVETLYPGLLGMAVGEVFELLANLFGSEMWENKGTR